MKLWLLLATVFLGFPPERTWADGKIFPPTAYPVEVRIPDQRALLAWSNGVERLVIETRFNGAGTNFAWVVPIPSPPKVEPATSGLFPTLTHLLRPKVIHTPTGWWRLGLFLAALIWLLLTVKKDGHTQWSDWIAAIALGVSASGMGGWVFGVLIFALAAAGAYQGRTRGLRGFEVFLWLLLPFLLTGLLLPALSTAKAGGASEPVEILDRQLAGIFETTTLTGRDPAALRDWLTTNGYALSPETEPVIADYLREGWVFVASKVRRDGAAGETSSLHPLSFTFAAKAPVYPLRLTRVGNGRLEVDLFVFGPERARIDGFEVRDSRPVDYPPRHWRQAESWQPSLRGLPMAHEGLRGMVPDAFWVTRLKGTLTPKQMLKDAEIHWDGINEHREQLFSPRGALITAANWTVNLFSVFVVGAALVSWMRGADPNQATRWLGIGGVLAAVATGVFYAKLPVVPVTLEKRWARQRDARDQQLAVRFALRDELNTNAPVTLTAVRAALQRGLPLQLSQYLTNPLTFQIREEDSPYNYSFRSNSTGVFLLLYDRLGRAEAFSLPEP